MPYAPAVAVIAWLLIGLLPSPRWAASPSREVLAVIDGFVARSIAEAGVPGAALAIVADERIVFSRGYGSTGLRADDAPMSPQSLTGIGSVGKTFTATAILQLRDAERLDLDRPVLDYIPELRLADPEATRRITVRHLLTITDGLGPARQRILHEDGTFDLPPRELVARLPQAALDGGSIASHRDQSVEEDHGTGVEQANSTAGFGKFRSQTGTSLGTSSIRLAIPASFGQCASNHARRGCQRDITPT
jgi:CubicO group peptidase (beta-lactamase class C family)